jgi:hypothetical protein
MDMPDIKHCVLDLHKIQCTHAHYPCRILWDQRIESFYYQVRKYREKKLIYLFMNTYPSSNLSKTLLCALIIIDLCVSTDTKRPPIDMDTMLAQCFPTPHRRHIIS